MIIVANAVSNVANLYPASILQLHSCNLLVDANKAATVTLYVYGPCAVLASAVAVAPFVGRLSCAG